MIYHNELGVDRFVVTWKPFGLYMIRYSCVLKDGEVAFVEQRIGRWVGVGPNKAAGDVAKGSKEVVRFLKSAAKTRKAKKVESGAGRTVYAFDHGDSQGHIVLETGARASGEIVEYSDASLSSYEPRIRESMWFGTAVKRGDSVVRDKRTTSIPHRDGQWFVWSVETGLDDPVEVSIVLRYPPNATVVDKSPEIVSNADDRVLEMPFGPSFGEFTVEFKVEESDPPGLYRADLMAEGTRIAVVAYELKAD